MLPTPLPPMKENTHKLPIPNKIVPGSDLLDTLNPKHFMHKEF